MLKIHVNDGSLSALYAFIPCLINLQIIAQMWLIFSVEDSQHVGLNTPAQVGSQAALHVGSIKNSCPVYIRKDCSSFSNRFTDVSDT